MKNFEKHIRKVIVNLSNGNYVHPKIGEYMPEIEVFTVNVYNAAYAFAGNAGFAAVAAYAYASVYKYNVDALYPYGGEPMETICATAFNAAKEFSNKDDFAPIATALAIAYIYTNNPEFAAIVAECFSAANRNTSMYMYDNCNPEMIENAVLDAFMNADFNLKISNKIK